MLDYYTTFSIEMNVTEKGFLKQNEIMKIIGQYLTNLRNSGPQEWFFDEIRRMRSINYQIQQKGNTIETMKYYSEKMKTWPVEEVLSGGYFFEDFDPQLIS